MWLRFVMHQGFNVTMYVEPCSFNCVQKLVDHFIVNNYSTQPSVNFFDVSNLDATFLFDVKRSHLLHFPWYFSLRGFSATFYCFLKSTAFWFFPIFSNILKCLSLFIKHQQNIFKGYHVYAHVTHYAKKSMQ